MQIDHHHHDQHAGIATYTIIFVWLVVLMLLTIAAWAVSLGPFNIIIAMLIAIIKAVLVIMYFMHVKYSGRLVWVFSAGAFFWLGILLVLTMSDYLSRTWVPRRMSDRPVAHLFAPSTQPATQPHSD
jgi:cytochrome c oxidase subunit 4